MFQLDVFQIPRPVPESAFSKHQIQILFDLWRVFTGFPKKCSTPQQQYAKMVPLQQNNVTELDWVMGSASPTSFIAYVKKQDLVMEDLRMAFKPLLTHQGVLESSDFLALMDRYVFWFENTPKSVNVLMIGDYYASPKRMLDLLVKTWKKNRFHVTLFYDMRWKCVLIDRVSKTFEYYDHLVDGGDQKSTRLLVRKLYSTARKLEPHIKKKHIFIARRGFDVPNTDERRCGLFVNTFLHSRIVKNYTFERAVNTKTEHATSVVSCDVFFRVIRRVSKSCPEPNLKFKSLELRLGILEFTRFLEYLIDLDPFRKTKLQGFQKELLDVAEKPVSNRIIWKKSVNVQDRLVHGDDVWVRIVQDIVSDPYTLFLRKVSKGSGRKKLGLHTFQEIVTGLKDRPPCLSREMNVHIRRLIDDVYLPVLHFSLTLKIAFFKGMLPREFVSVALCHQKTVSFGVHFLREMDNWVQKNAGGGKNTTLQKYSFVTSVTRPFTTSNMSEITSTMTKCEEVIQEINDLLKDVVVERVKER
jgi:hypothetical protein